MTRHEVFIYKHQRGKKTKEERRARAPFFSLPLSLFLAFSLHLFSFLNFLVFNAANESFNIYPINPRYNSKHSKMVTEINRPSIDISTDRYPTAAGNNYRLLAAVESTANRRINLNRFK